MSARKNNRLCLCALILLFLLSVLIFSLPVYRFEANVYTKRSGNTFIGDERYQAARAEVDAQLADYESRGIPTEVTEEVIERVNSKGETTSLIIFRINREIGCTGWDFIRTGFPSGSILIIILAAEALALLLACCAGIADVDRSGTDLRRKWFRQSAAILTVFGILLSVVFVLYTNVIINRRIGLYAAGVADTPGDAVLSAADALIYQGAGGQDTAALLKSTVSHCAVTWWLQIPVLLCMTALLVRLAGCEVKKVFLRGCLYLFVIIMCVVILYPFIIMFTSAFRTDADANDINYLHLFPVDWKWGNFSHILNRGVLKYLLNSLMLATGSTCLALLCGIPAAYALARMRFRGRKAFLGFVIMSQMFSPVVLLVGISRLLMDLNLNDTIPGLIFINAAFNQAFAIWLLRGTFVSISPEMEQAACIDGCNSVSALIRVLLPMAAPGIVTTLIFVFINSWNEYTISTVIIHSDSNFPITVGLTQFAAFSMIQWNYLFASALLATIPVVILFMLIEKHLVSGLTSGGVKG